jgi:integrase/recombinase XerD
MPARPTEPVTGDEFARMMGCLDRRKREHARVGALLVALRVGLRRGEIIELQVRDVIAVDGSLCLSVRTLKQKRGKRLVRVVPIADDRSAHLLRAYMEREHGRDPMPESPLFRTLGKHGTCTVGDLTPRAVGYWVKRLAQHAGITKRVSAHSFRHGFATDLLRRGADLRTVQEVLGHASVASTSLYLHTTHERCVEAVGRIQFE